MTRSFMNALLLAGLCLVVNPVRGDERETLVLMSLRGCLFHQAGTCRNRLDQLNRQQGSQHSPELTELLTQEMLAGLPARQVVLATGEGDWPYVIAMGPEGKPQRYSIEDRNSHEWAAFGDPQRANTLGWGRFWQAASNFANGYPGTRAVILRQQLDTPDETAGLSAPISAFGTPPDVYSDIAQATMTSPLLKLIRPGQRPILTGVPVHTLVVTLADSSHDPEKLSQIYPAIISSYGNVFSPTDTSVFLEQPSSTATNNIRLQSARTGKCLSQVEDTLQFETCQPASLNQHWTQMGAERFRLRNSANLGCLADNLQFSLCSQIIHNWMIRRDLAHAGATLSVQNLYSGKYITAGPDDAVILEPFAGEAQNFAAFNGPAEGSNYTLQVQASSGAVSVWNLYPGVIAPDGFVTAVVNVPSESRPVLARLLRDGQVIDIRSFTQAHPSAEAQSPP